MFKGLICAILFLFFLSACQHPYTPKARGLPRVHLPKKQYQPYLGVEPLTFDIPLYAQVVPVKRDGHAIWFNIKYDTLQTVLYVSFQSKLSKAALDQQMQVGSRLAMEHAIKATSIKHRTIRVPSHGVYGLFYTLEGATASPLQFFVTDSTSNYLRGALYFNETTRRDSVQPVIDFLEKDLMRMIQSLRWK